MIGKRKTRASSRPSLPLWKKTLFGVIAMGAFFGFLELALYLLGVDPARYASDPFVGFAANLPLFVEERDDDGRVHLRTAQGKLAWFNPQRFPREKGYGTYRIFSLGGSTTYGRPYTDGASFSGWLRELLPALDPARRWEVINCGGISYASYRVALLMEELIDYAPDLFVIYTGHNEFLERRTYGDLIETPRTLTEAGGLLSRTRTHALLTRLIAGGPPPSSRATGSEPTLLGAEVDTRLEHSVGPSDYTRDDELRAKVVAHFRFNLHRMIDMARSVGADVLLVTPAANLRDCSPFKSEAGARLDGSDVMRFDELYRRAETSRSAGDLLDALAALEAARAIDGRHADLHYRRGQLLYELGRHEEASTAFDLALEEDVCPLRAPRSIREAVIATTAERDAPLVDFARELAERSEHGIPGAEVFHDHVHLTVEGYLELALEVLELLSRRGIVGAAPPWNERAVEDVKRKVLTRIDRRAQGIALRNLAKVYSWAGKMEEAARMAAAATGLLGDDAESALVLGRSAEARGELDAAIVHYRSALALHPDFADAHLNVGRALRAKGEIDEAIRHYGEALRIRPGFEDARFNLALALRLKGEPEEAARHLRRVIEQRPSDAAAHYHLAEALGVLDRRTDAIAHYTEAIRWKPQYAEAHCNLGVLLLEEGGPEKAERHLRAALAIRPGFAEAHHNLAVLLHSRDRRDDAESHYRRAIEANPAHVDACYNLAVILHTTRRLDEAVKLYLRVLELTPENADAHYNLGLVLHSRGQVEGAVHHYREALRHDPQHEKARRRLAMARGEQAQRR